MANSTQTKETPIEDYIQQMKTIYAPDPDAVEGLDNILVIAGGVASVLSFVAMVIWIVFLALFLIRAAAGRVSIKNLTTWKRFGLSLFIIFMVLTGGVMLVLSQLYDQMFEGGWLWK